MKVLYLYLLLALIPTKTLFSITTNQSRNLNGVWVDSYSDVVVEIKSHRKGLKIRQIKRFKKTKWKTYYKLGYSTFDDCDGRSIVIIGRNRIRWNKGRFKEFVLKRERLNTHYYNQRNSNRGRDRRSDYNNRSFGYHQDYEGQWYCPEQRLYLDIEYFNGGFRARRPNKEWNYYEPDRRGNYHDRNGNTYFYENDRLCWTSNDRDKTLRFSRR